MRIISGELKGHRLIAPKGKSTRPTEDRVKESIFNILTPIKYHANVLDLFSGSGQIGIEFLSRGAAWATFVDSARDSISTIHQNLERTRYKDKSKVIKSNYINALKHLNEESIEFDYIYMDPPFQETKLFINSLEKIARYKILKNDGILIVEHGKDMILEDVYDFKLIDKRKYGNVEISIYNKG